MFHNLPTDKVSWSGQAVCGARDQEGERAETLVSCSDFNSVRINLRLQRVGTRI